MSKPALEAGLAILEAGRDFADDLIVYERHWRGGETFVSIAKKAVARLKAQRRNARLP